MAESAGPESAATVIARLPRTFRPSFNDQMAQWDLLFPAEQRQLRRQLGWLSRLPPPEFKSLFAPIVEIENKMELPRWEANAKGMSVQEVGLLARSPYYAQWRAEVAKVFDRMEQGAGSGPVKVERRLVLCLLPEGVPAPRDPLWPELSKQGTWVTLTKPLGPLLPQWAKAIATRKRPPEVEDVESTWVLETESRFAGLASSPAATVLSWTALAPARREFLNRLNAIRRDLKSVDQVHQDLKRMDIDQLLGPGTGDRPRIREFVRGLLLSGNGSLVFPNSFVQWGASEALRRAEPHVLMACFGLRQKLKPFSSTVLFEDQTRGNPVGDEDDPAGSLVDAIMLAQYVYLAAQRVPAYQSNTLSILGGASLNRALVLQLQGERAPQTPEQFVEFTLRWLESGG